VLGILALVFGVDSREGFTDDQTPPGMS